MDEFKKRGVTVAGVVVDSVEENAQLQRDAGLEFPILSDPKFDLIGAYELRHPSGHDGHDIALSASVLLDGGGVVRWTFVTPNLRIRPTPDQVLAAIDALPRR
jgi:peroxiredoxin